MIILKATTETLQMTTSTAAAIDYSATFADITTTVLSPSTNEGTLASATTTTIVAAPASSTKRQVKLITISNRDVALSCAIVIQKNISSTTYNMTPTMTLLVGETMQYMDGSGWIYYSATGSIKGSQTAAGSNTQIQFNNNGVLAGDPDLTWNSSTNTLALGTNPQINLSDVSVVPSTPAASTLSVFANAVAGKMQLIKMGPDGNPEALQAALWQNNVVIWTPGAAAGTGLGAAITTGGTASAILPTTTNVYTAMRRSKFVNSTTANVQAGMSTDTMFFGEGGFLFVCRFGIEAYTASTTRLFVGLSASTTMVAAATTAANVTATTTNTIGFGWNTGDTAITLMSVNSSGSQITQNAISGQPTLAANNGYDAYIYWKPNDSVIYYRLDNSNTGVTLVDTSIQGTLPFITTMMKAVAVASTTSTTASTIGIGVNRMYIETNR